MTSSPDTQHRNHTTIIHDESEQYRGLDATSYTARRLVRIDTTDPRSNSADSSTASITLLHITYT